MHNNRVSFRANPINAQLLKKHCKNPKPMLLKFKLSPRSLPFSFTFLSPLIFPRLSSLSLLKPLIFSQIFTTTTTVVSVSLDHSIPYGPSLRKGCKPSQLSSICQNLEENDCNSSGEESDDNLFDEDSFTRVFDVAALRVPSEHCFALETRLRGHLLNWPRIRNIARVPGDEVEDEFKDILPQSSTSSSNNGSDDVEGDELVSLSRRIYGKAEGDGELLSPVLYRDKLARTFNSKGFVKFRNLAKMSRPKRKKKREEETRKREKKGIGRNEMAVVKVIEEAKEEGEGGDFRGLLGDEFKELKWRSSTRLLLLDEQYANKGVNELPEAIKLLLNDGGQDMKSSFELVKCKLTLFYTYWQTDEILEALLPKDMVVPSSFETVGHIAHLNLREEHIPYKRFIAKVVLDKNKPKIQTVVNKVDVIHNDYRTMQLEVLAGNHSLVTTVVENGLRFHVDLATVYWNSRLATERQRLLDCFTHDDVVCDVFAGIGPISISAARKVKHVYANDLNPHAVDYLERNCVLNKLERRIEVFNMDGRRFIEAIFGSQKTRSITQVVMNLPNNAVDFLDAFRGVFVRKPKDKEFILPKIHVYGFSKAQDPEFDFEERVRIALSEVAYELETRRVRLVAPGKWMLCASFVLPERVAFAKAAEN